LVSCAAPPPPIPNRVTTIDGAQYFIHQVKHAGESASIIASWYLGASDQTVFILAANPHISDAKKTLVVGTPVLLPYTKITQKEPIPEQYVQAMKPKTTKIAPKKWRRPQKKFPSTKSSPSLKSFPTPTSKTELNSSAPPTVQPTAMPESIPTNPAPMLQEKSPSTTSTNTQSDKSIQSNSKTGTVEDDLLKELLGQS
jgi:hypothetical protein